MSSNLDSALQTLTEIEAALRVVKDQITLAILQQGTKQGVTQDGQMDVNKAAGGELKPLRKVEWVAKILDVSVQRVYELTRQKAIPSIRVGEGRIRFDEDAIYEWIRTGGTTK